MVRLGQISSVYYNLFQFLTGAIINKCNNFYLSSIKLFFNKVEISLEWKTIQLYLSTALSNNKRIFEIGVITVNVLTDFQ